MRSALRLACCVFPILAAASRAPAEPEAACITLADFAEATVGSFPTGWRVRQSAGEDVYRVAKEGPLRFLRARAEGVGIQAAVEHEWDLDVYPMLSWSWRPRVFPTGADEQHGKNDSVLSVYLLVPHSRIRGPKAVKYVWSERVAAGTNLSSNFGLTQVRVIRTGEADGDGWVRERVNARDDFRALFAVDESPTPAGIAVLTDADDTASHAEGDYADFRACRD
jgi:hypothetical protein